VELPATVGAAVAMDQRLALVEADADESTDDEEQR